MINYLNNETTPTINTVGLKQQLAGQKGRVVGLVPQFRKEVGFMPLFATILSWLNEVWTRFENTACAVLVDTSQQVRSAIREFDPAGLIAGYKLEMETATARLRQRLYAILTQKFGRDRDRSLELSRLTEQRPLLADSIWVQVVRMTGDPDAIIRHINFTMHYATVALVFAFLVAIEGMGGYDMFEFQGSPISAIAWSLITIIIMTAASHFAGTNRAILNAFQDSQRIYMQKCMGYDAQGNLAIAATDINGNPVYLSEPNRSVYMMARWSEIILACWSIGLVVFRTVLAIHNPKQFGWNAVIGSVAMGVLAWVYYLMEVRFSPKYDKQQQKAYEDAVTSLENLDADIIALSGLDPDDPYNSDRELVIGEYNLAADNAVARVNNDLAYRRETCALYLSLVEQYRSAHQFVRRSYHGLIQDAANAVSKAVAGLDVNEYNNPEKTKQIDDFFARAITLELNSDDLVAETKNFDPKVELPSARVNDFTPIEAEVLAQVQTEASAVGSNGPMIFNW